ncbi:MAG: hypothetical protein ABL982_26625, partial [Vicinamibacterales bacterium]
MRHLERAVPDDDHIRRYLEAQRPDLLLITPLIDLGSSQIDYLRAARDSGVPSALCVWSWDHLSSKALIRECPDRVFVWNETQKQEAVTLHDVDPERIVVTGAQCFDQWFDRQPSRSRETFCREVGLNPARQTLLYVCSALFAGSPVEAHFVLSWIRAVRASESPLLRDANILIRPHPSRMAEWADVEVSSLGAVLWGQNPTNPQTRANYFDSLYYSDAVVGLNTSAFIEAGILGRPVHTVVLPEFSANQTGTVHFGYLTSVAGGLVVTSANVADHLRQLHESLLNPPVSPRPFIQAFVRPHGLNVPATPFFVEQVEAAGQLAPAPAQQRPGAFWRWAAGQLARTRDSRSLERWTLSWRELDSIEHAREEQQRKAFRRAAERAES